jgi:hypothetical protein
VPSTVPAAPIILSAVAMTGSVVVSWSSPDPAGAPITSYIVTASGSGGQSCAVSGAPAPQSCMVTGLVAGVQYTFVVRACNANGLGPASQASVVVAP